MRNVSLLSAFLLPLALVPEAHGDGKARHVYDQTVPCTALVRAGKNGTGWLLDVERKWLVTSLRLLSKEPTVEVIFPEFDGKDLIAERAHYDQKAKPISGKVIARDGKRDLALIELDSVPDGSRALRLAESSPSAGEHLHAVANTVGSQGLWSYSAGIVRQVYRRKDGALDCDVVVSQMPINAGDGGAPVVNDAGELVGALAGSVEKTRLVTYAVDVKEVRQFVARFADLKKANGKPPMPLPADDRARLSGEEAFARMLSSTVWIVPNDAKRTAGTGCLVDQKRKLVLTALSVIGKDETAKVWFPAHEDGKLIGKRDHYQKRIEPILARVTQREPRSGLAVLELASLPAAAAEFKLANGSAGPTDEVRTVGNPIFTTGLWVYHAGVVRQTFHGKATTKEPDFAGRVLETQTPFNPGDAGGPVVDVRGELVGIVDTPLPNTKYVTCCIDVVEIRKLLKR